MIYRSAQHSGWSVAAAALVIASSALSSSAGAEDAEDTVVAAAVQHGARSADASHAGIWKAVTPPDGSMHGEFDGDDPIGLAAGSRIPADCSINWKDPDFGKLYCFSSATSLVYFLDSPRKYLARAQKNWTARSDK
ncbi:MAG: hypothetical protein WB646_20635 [Steroidobacteraceae bacterium]